MLGTPGTTIEPETWHLGVIIEILTLAGTVAVSKPIPYYVERFLHSDMAHRDRITASHKLITNQVT